MSLAINMTSSYDPSTSTSSAKKWQCDSNASDAESELDLFPPRGKRLAPVGANADDDDDSSCRKAEVLRTLMCEAEQQQLMQQQGGGSAGEAEELRRRLREMEDDQEELNTSLMSMTSHYAKVSCL